MLVGKKIAYVDGIYDIEFSHGDTSGIENSIYENILLSIILNEDLAKIKKCSENSKDYAILYIKECLKWLVDSGRLTSINVLCELDKAIDGRLNIMIAAFKASNKIQYSIFYDIS